MGAPSFVSFLPDNDIKEVFTASDSLYFHSDLNASVKKSKNGLVLIMGCEQLYQFHELKINSSILQRLKGLLIKESIESLNMSDTFLDNLNLSGLKKLSLDFTGLNELRRIAWAWNIGAETDLIADFKIIDNRIIYIKTCNFGRLIVPVSKVNVLKNLPLKALNNYRIDKFGSYVHWEGPDIHLDLESFKEIQNPKLLLKYVEYNKKYGKALRHLREQFNLKQNELGLSDKQIRRFELGENRPTIKALTIMANAHKLALNVYLNKLAEIYQKL